MARHFPIGIYAVPDSVPDVVPYYAELDARGRAQGEVLLRFVQAVVADSRARVAWSPQVTVVDVHGGNHFIFLQRPGEVARAMRAFLSGGRPASSESGLSFRTEPARSESGSVIPISTSGRYDSGRGSSESSQ